MKRTYIKDLKAGESVLLKGWIYEIRNLAKIEFILLRDMTGIVQCIVKDRVLIEKFSDLNLESVVEIEGRVKKAKIKAEFARKDFEVEVSNIKIISKAEKLPIHVNEKTTRTDLSKRLDYRSLDLRKPKVQAVFRIQTEIIKAFKDFFYNRGFLEMQPPCIISSSSEGGTELFKVKYFEKEAYLAQSPQLYKQMVACSIGKTFSLCPVWRAEKHSTTRHINEIRQMDIEMPFSKQFDVMKEQEEVVKYIVKKVIENCKRELDLLKIKLKVPKAKYISYDETLKILKEKGLNIKYGEDLTPEAEKKLDEIFPDTIVFVHSWPASLKPFYIMPKDENADSKLSEGFDSIYKGLEISSGGQRIHIPELLEKMLKKKKLNPENFKDYIDSFRFGAPAHGGWSIGLERLTQILCGLKNVKEATMFPRDRYRLTP